MSLSVNLKTAKELVKDTFAANGVAMLHSSPGVGKSAIIKQIADEYNLQLIDERLSTADPTDLKGFPTLSDGIAEFVPMNTFPLDTWSVPKGKNGWILFLDEFNSAPPAVQTAAYKIVLDRMIGLHNLHPNCFIVCAGNLATDKAIVNRVGTAMQSRLHHIEIHVEPDVFLDYAREKDFDPRIVSYLEFRPENIHQFNPDHSDKTFACPRTWEFTNNLLKLKREGWQDLDISKLPLLAGTIGEGIAREFYGFCRSYADLPAYDDIVKDPTQVKINPSADMQYAIAGYVGSSAKKEHLSEVFTFIKRLNTEIQAVVMRSIRSRMPAVTARPEWKQWVMDNRHIYTGA